MAMRSPRSSAPRSRADTGAATGAPLFYGVGGTVAVGAALGAEVGPGVLLGPLVGSGVGGFSTGGMPTVLPLPSTAPDQIQPFLPSSVRSISHQVPMSVSSLRPTTPAVWPASRKSITGYSSPGPKRTLAL